MSLPESAVICSVKKEKADIVYFGFYVKVFCLSFEVSIKMFYYLAVPYLSAVKIYLKRVKRSRCLSFNLRKQM